MSYGDPIKLLFSPIKINQLEIRNRIVLPAMHLGYTPGGLVSDRLVEFYRERAKGGVGLDRHRRLHGRRIRRHVGDDRHPRRSVY